MPGASTAFSSPSAQLPILVGRYAIYRRIATGGMAAVHLGRLTGHAGFARTVAIKRLHAHLAQDQEFVVMFMDEARIAARIQHPNVVSTTDVVSTGDELLLVMDYVHGESLSRLVRASVQRGTPVPPPIAGAILSGVLRGLHSAHEARDELGRPLQIVHRDVSPQNVLVGADGIPRVLDFGVASAIGRMQSTRSGSLKGKLAYMSPERLRGEPADRRADVYAAAVVLWEMLVGKRLFPGEDDAQVLARVLKGCDEPPSARVAGMPSLLDAVVMRGLANEPSKRFQTAEEMAIALEMGVTIGSPSDVSAWVRDLAREQLDERASAVAEIESHSGSIPSAPEVLPDSDLQTAVSDVHSTPSKSSPISQRLRAAARAAPPLLSTALGVGIPARRALVAVGVAIALGIVVAIVLALRPGPAPAGVTAAPSSSAPVVMESAAAIESAPSESPPTVDIQDLSPVADTASAPPRPAPPQPFAPATPPPRPRPHVSCDPPYFYDSAGVKHYKRECN
ncbi:MAG TPA: serine/threonine-protein kinase [Polyangiaceae bacterium]